MAQNNVRTGQPEDFMRIQDLFYLCLSKWYWFVISLGITLSVAILYVLVTPPVYMRSAALRWEALFPIWGFFRRTPM